MTRRSRPSGLTAGVLATALLGILLSVLTIAFLANNVQREVDALAVANSDTTQWSLAQTEVELLALLVAIREAEPGQPPDLRQIRRRYDILFSRIQLISEGRQLADLRANAEATGNIADLKAFLDRHTTSIDGPDAQLLAKLPEIASDLARLRAVVRDLSLLGVRFYAEDSDDKRKGVSATLASIGYLTLGLVLALLGGIAILLALYRRSIRSERVAADARSRLQEVIATSLDGIIAADAEGRVLEYNGAAERVFGYAPDEAIGRNMSDLIIPDHLRAAHEAGMKRYRANGERRVVGKGLARLEARRKDGTIFPVELSLSAATFGGQEIFVSFLRDISHRVAAEQELILARDSAVTGERAKAELLAVMSHEMRTPLNGILGTIELLQGTKPTPRQRRFIAAMKTSADLLLHHVNGVLSISRAEAGQLDLMDTEVDPAELLQELVESQRHAIEANGNTIKCDTSAAPPAIWIDPLRLRQVILNLVANANKFTRRGEILVECDVISDRRQVEFRVIDTGIGIAEADLDRIFEEFRTLDTSYSRAAEGTGLGLAISRRLVHAMQGEIGVDSEPGEGSLFWVRLPIGAAPQSGQPKTGLIGTSPPLADKSTPAPPLHVLLVEDNQINRLVAREMLQGAGHSVVEAHDGREGVYLAGCQRFDAILMDISMPELDGVTATRFIRDSDGPNRSVPIIALTAHALPDDTKRFLAAGITDTLIKPLTLAALQNALAFAKGPSRPVVDAAPTDTATVLADLARQLGEDRVAQLLDSFRAEAEQLIARTADQAWSGAPLATRVQAVHRLAGSASVLGATRLHQLLQALEDDYRQGDATAAGQRLTALPGIWQETVQQLQVSLALCEPK